MFFLGSNHFLKMIFMNFIFIIYIEIVIYRSLDPLRFVKYYQRMLTKSCFVLKEPKNNYMLNYYYYYYYKLQIASIILRGDGGE